MNKIGWGPQDMPGEQPVCWEIGPLHLWVKSVDDEFWIAYTYHEADGNSPPFSLEELRWHRWTLKRRYEKIQLLPAFPERSVVVRPEFPFHVSRGVRTRIYVRIPIWVKIMLGKVDIVELPSMRLAKTWFGSHVDGELCYCLTTAARKVAQLDGFTNRVVYCPIEIVNRSNEELQVDKICHQVRKLSIYAINEQLWSNETKIEYRGEDEVSQVEIGNKPPAEAQRAAVLSPPRDGVSRGFSARTFHTLKDLANLDFLSR